jgi:uncharacterized DUF497 family protein
MAWQHFLWTDENTAHVGEHGISTADFEYVVNNPDEYSVSHSSGLPCAFGYTPDGRYIIAVFEEIDDMTVYPVTAYEVPEPRRRSK